MSNKNEISFGSVKNIILIGGGDLMFASACLFKEKNFSVNVIIAPRHSDEKLTSSGTTLTQELSAQNVNYTIIEDINTLTNTELKQYVPIESIALCYGPAWVFKPHVINCFSQGMYNINPIPIPHYLGGAHYTWQLLNRNVEGGCFFQEITEDLDQGDIIDSHYFTINEKSTTPNDYFAENLIEGMYFIDDLVNKIQSNYLFKRQAYDDVNSDRLYLPRLRTDKQGFINWQWDVDDIVSFSQGFDDPYKGASTFINGIQITIKKLKKNIIAQPMHPFATGLIVRKTKLSIIVAAPKGFIEITDVFDMNEKNIMSSLREGMRLYTPTKILDDAMAYQVILTASGFKD
ncbi:MAG: hypothetical protein HRT52_06480 [Colwellia sp.]|nr:hypothetical protein [Colwellia sp.]NQZ80648.1 hypothetical protein [Colwellia sp.]